MKNSIVLLVLYLILATACSTSPETAATHVASTSTAIASAWTATPTPAFTSTPTSTRTPTITPTFTPRPTWPPVVAVSSDLLQYCKDKVTAINRMRPHLHMLSQCEVASGIIIDKPLEWSDKDYGFDLHLDPGYEQLARHQQKKQDGILHIEIEPQEYRLRLSELPKKGMHIVVVGVWVVDVGAGWNEIHPVWFWAEVAP